MSGSSTRIDHQKGHDSMRITVYEKGNVGGGLADKWVRAGHQVTRLGRDDGDISDADVLVVAVPGRSVAHAFDKLTGLEGKTVIDATNRIGVDPPGGFASNAEFIRSVTGGAHSEVVQRQLRISLRTARRSACATKQSLVRRRGRT